MGVWDRQGAGQPPGNGHSSAQVSSRLLVGRLGRPHANCIAGEYYINQYNIIGGAGVYCGLAAALPLNHSHPPATLDVFPLPGCQINTNPIMCEHTVEYWQQWWWVVIN